MNIKLLCISVVALIMGLYSCHKTVKVETTEIEAARRLDRFYRRGSATLTSQREDQRARFFSYPQTINHF